MADTWTILLSILCVEFTLGLKENLAFQKPAWQSSNHNPSQYLAGNGVDGDTSSFVLTNAYMTPGWWVVDLQMEVQDATVTVYFRNPPPLTPRKNGLRLLTSQTNFTSHPGGEWCTTFTYSALDVVDVICPGSWRYLAVYSITVHGADVGAVIDFAEVQVWGCEIGTYGAECNGNCGNCYHIRPTRSCHQDTGVCPDGCQPGWKNTYCTQECDNGISYGRNCEGNCSNRHCLNLGAPCDVKTGACEVEGCMAGWEGTDCTLGCSVGANYGRNCEMVCSNRPCMNDSASCDVQTGSCGVEGCQAGWMGTDCYQECQNETSYGANCESSCGSRHCLNTDASCDVQTGSCGQEGCQAGWTGDDCTEACLIGETYGFECASNCSDRHCRSAVAPCDVQTGSCENTKCRAGWMGIDCTAECEQDQSYGVNCERNCSDRHCLNPLFPCDVQTGSCGTEGCQPGWTGTDCYHECVVGEGYGLNCAKICSDRHCLNPSASCDVQTGSCGVERCQAGWTGTDCALECPLGQTYGMNCDKRCSYRHCLNPSASCDVQTGSCGADRCQAGWFGEECIQECNETSYGFNCEGKCDARHCLNPTNTCDRLNGKCPDGCEEDWTGIDCTKQCVEGKYGLNCERSCSSRYCLNPLTSCDVQTGSCGVERCQTGWMGEDCTERIPTESNGVMPWIYGGAVGAAITLAIGILVCVCLSKQGRLKWVNHSSDGNTKSSSEMTSVVADADWSTRRQVYANYYDVMNPEAMDDDKLYEVIRAKHEGNV